MTRLEKFLLRLDDFPCQAVYRLIIGLAFLPVMHFIGGQKISASIVFGSFLGVLLALRIGPAVVRHVLPFSRDLLIEWERRRQLAKRHDSYQWRKLFWMGVGLGLYILVSRTFYSAYLILSSICVAGGAKGAITWNRTASAMVKLQNHKMQF